jgi:uncharacterized protein YceK
MLRGALSSLLVAGAAWCGGCGTIITAVNGDCGPQSIWHVDFGPYSGLRSDADWFVAGPPYTFVTVVDMPLSIAADTVLLPISIPWAIDRAAKSRPAPRPEPGPSWPEPAPVPRGTSADEGAPR